MTKERQREIGEFINTYGKLIDFTDDGWMDELDWQEHKTKDIIDLLHWFSIYEQVKTLKEGHILHIAPKDRPMIDFLLDPESYYNK